MYVPLLITTSPHIHCCIFTLFYIHVRGLQICHCLAIAYSRLNMQITTNLCVLCNTHQVSEYNTTEGRRRQNIIIINSATAERGQARPKISQREGNNDHSNVPTSFINHPHTTG